MPVLARGTDHGGIEKLIDHPHGIQCSHPIMPTSALRDSYPSAFRLRRNPESRLSERLKGMRIAPGLVSMGVNTLALRKFGSIGAVRSPFIDPESWCGALARASSICISSIALLVSLFWGATIAFEYPVGHHVMNRLSVRKENRLQPWSAAHSISIVCVHLTRSTGIALEKVRRSSFANHAIRLPKDMANIMSPSILSFPDM